MESCWANRRGVCRQTALQKHSKNQSKCCIVMLFLISKTTYRNSYVILTAAILCYAALKIILNLCNVVEIIVMKTMNPFKHCTIARARIAQASEVIQARSSAA